MTTVSKCLTVFALVASLVFLGVVSVSKVGGRNFEGDLNNPEFEGYAFTKAEGDDGKATWSAETRLPRRSDPTNAASKIEIQKVATNKKVLPQAMIDVLTAESRAQTAKIGDLDKRIGILKKKVADAIAAKNADRKAIQKRIDGLITAMADAQTALSTLNKTIETTEDGSKKKQSEYFRRLDEIKRLEDQVEILKADKVRLDEQLVKLEVVEKQLKGEVSAARARNKQLKQNSSSSGTSTPKPPASTTSLP